MASNDVLIIQNISQRIHFIYCLQVLVDKQGTARIRQIALKFKVRSAQPIEANSQSNSTHAYLPAVRNKANKNFQHRPVPTVALITRDIQHLQIILEIFDWMPDIATGLRVN